MEPQRERSPLDIPQRQQRVCRYQDIKRDFFVFRLPTHPTQCNFPKECQVKHYLAGIRETDSRIRRIVKEGSAGTPLSPTVEFGNSLNKTWKDWFTDFCPLSENPAPSLQTQSYIPTSLSSCFSSALDTCWKRLPTQRTRLQTE